MFHSIKREKVYSRYTQLYCPYETCEPLTNIMTSRYFLSYF